MNILFIDTFHPLCNFFTYNESIIVHPSFSDLKIFMACPVWFVDLLILYFPYRKKLMENMDEMDR
jgi:hypothetical protein